MCTVGICQWNGGLRYVFARCISRYILPIPCDKCFSGIHCTHPSHISWGLDTHLQCNSVRLGIPQFPSTLLSLDWHSSISFHTWFPAFCAPQFPLGYLSLDCRLHIELRICYLTPHLPLSALLHLYGRFSSLVGAPKTRFGTLQSPLVLFFIPCSFHTFCVSLICLVVAPHFHRNNQCLLNAHSDSQLANFSSRVCYISHIERNDIGIQFHSLARYIKSIYTRSAASLLALVRNCVLLPSPEWDGRWRGLHSHHVWLILFDHLVRLLFWCSCIYFWITHLLLWFLNVVQQKIQCWRRW